MYVEELTFVKFAREYGIAEGKAEVAARLLKKNMDIATITEYTGLTEDEVKKIKESL